MVSFIDIDKLTFIWLFSIVKTIRESYPQTLPPFPVRGNLIMNNLLIGALVCFLSFGNYFIFGCPAGLHTQFKNDLGQGSPDTVPAVILESISERWAEKDRPTNPDIDMTEVQFMSLYSFANWPRVIISRVWRIRTIAKLHKDQTVRVVYTYPPNSGS